MYLILIDFVGRMDCLQVAVQHLKNDKKMIHKNCIFLDEFWIKKKKELLNIYSKKTILRASNQTTVISTFFQLVHQNTYLIYWEGKDINIKKSKHKVKKEFQLYGLSPSEWEVGNLNYLILDTQLSYDNIILSNLIPKLNSEIVTFYRRHYCFNYKL